MRKISILLGAAAALVVAGAASAHHSAIQFDFTKNVPVKGQVKSFEAINPHMRMILHVTDPKGTRDIEFEGFGGTSGQRVGRTVELIDICRQAWSGAPVEHEGRYYQRHGLVVTPLPYQPGGPPIMIGGHHPNAIDRAAALADRFVMDAGTDSEAYEQGEGTNRDLFARVESAVRLYREALERHGKPSEQPSFSLNVGGFLHPDGADAAWATVAEAYMLTRRVYGDWYGLEESEYATWYPDQMTPQQVAQRRSEILLGTPDDITPILARVRDVVGENFHVMFRSKYPLVDDAAIRQSIDLLGEVRERLTS